LDMGNGQRSLAVLGAAVILSLALGAVDAYEPFNLHLSWEGDPATSMTVNWKTEQSCDSVVQFGKTTSYDRIKRGKPGVFHSVMLDGLEPDTTYHFRFGDGENWSWDYTFKTAPRSGGFTFLVIGDTLADLGDTKWPTLAPVFTQTEGSFIIHVGDLVLTGSNEESWDKFFQLDGEPVWTLPLMPCLGNHEENAEIYFEQFALPDAEQWYSFDYCNAHFVSLSTETDIDGVQLKWLIDDLENTNATWKIVYFHKPAYCSSGGWENVRKKWCPIFDKYHVDLVFSGHIHVYERTKPIRNGSVMPTPEQGTTYIITGGGGAHLGSVYRQRWIESEGSFYHFLRLSINGSSLHGETILANGTVVDTFDMTKRPTPDLVITETVYSPEYPAPGDEITIRARVWNRGDAEAPPFWLSAKFGGAMSSTLVNGLRPGEAREAEVSWKPRQTGRFEVLLVADGEDMVDEGFFEDNNAANLSINVSPPRPELRVSSLWMSSPGPGPGEEVSLLAEVENKGRRDAGPFKVRFRAGESFMDIEPVEGLPAGEKVVVESSRWRLPQGRFLVVATPDSADEVDEYDDADQASLPLYLLDFYQDGPVRYPRGCVEGEEVVIGYNTSIGAIPQESTCCTLLWWISGNQMPMSQLWPNGSAATGPMVETPMHRALDGLWYAVIPTDARTETIHFKFRDRQMVGRVWDDNGGEGWTIGLRGWLQSRIDELSEAVQAAENLGSDTGRYRSILDNATRCMEDGVYLPCSRGLEEATAELRAAVVRHDLEEARGLVEQARSMQIDTSAVENLLDRAAQQLEEGLIDPASFSAETALSMVRRMIEKAPEGRMGATILVFATIAGPLLLTRRDNPRQRPSRPARHLGKGHPGKPESS